MDSQQLLDHIIKPALEYMGGNYNSKDAQMLLLATAAIESKCGYYIKQVGGPALGIWQMEPATESDIWKNCDNLKDKISKDKISKLEGVFVGDALMYEPIYACAMARLKYSMDPESLPHHGDWKQIYEYYKRIYNTELGASTWDKFKTAWKVCGLDNVKL